MRARSKEEMAAYQRERRSHVTPVVTPVAFGVVTPADVTPIVTPKRVVDVVNDLNLDMAKDLGIYGWTADGIFIRPDITVSQVQNIARLIHAKHGRPCPEFKECR